MIEDIINFATTPVYGLPVWVIALAGVITTLVGISVRLAVLKVLGWLRRRRDGIQERRGGDEGVRQAPPVHVPEPAPEPETESETATEPDDATTPDKPQDTPTTPDSTVSRHALYETIESNRYYLAALAALGGYAYVALIGPTVLVIVLTLVFLATFAFIPILAYTLGSSLPAFIAEPLGKMLISVGLGGLGSATMRLSDGEYRKHAVVETDENQFVDDSKFYQFGLGKVAFGYKRTKESFGSLTDTVDTETLDDLDESHIKPGKIDAGTERNGYREFIDTKAPPYSIFIRVAEALSLWQDSASIDEAHIGENKARQEHSKKQAGGGPDRTIGDRIEWLILFGVGAGIGWVFFF